MPNSLNHIDFFQTDQQIEVTSIEFVFTLFGGLALIGGGLTYFLFETKGKELPNTVEEMIELQKESPN